MIFWEFQGGEFSQQDKVHEWDKTMDAKFEKDAKGVAREPIINGWQAITCGSPPPAGADCVDSTLRRKGADPIFSARMRPSPAARSLKPPPSQLMVN
jgi:hypothetical protein